MMFRTIQNESEIRLFFYFLEKSQKHFVLHTGNKAIYIWNKMMENK